jgi:hypothetical protein
VIGDGHAEHDLGLCLAYYVLIKKLAQFLRINALGFGCGFGVISQEIFAQCHTLIADCYLVTDDEFLHMVLVLAAKTAGL